MLSLKQILENYPVDMRGFEEEILREYLQYKLLQGIFNLRESNQFNFIGGTAIRIIFGSDRFSEDIDFDNFGLSWEKFNHIMENTRNFLILEGFSVETTFTNKGAFHCAVRFPNILSQYGLPSQRDQKIHIRVDTTAQGVDYVPELQVINKFDVFSGIRVPPVDILLSMKIVAALSRKRPKGRDFFDITFLLGQTQPNYSFLNQKKGIGTSELLREAMFQRIDPLDFDALANDVSPFLIRKGDVNRVKLFKTYWEQAVLD